MMRGALVRIFNTVKRSPDEAEPGENSNFSQCMVWNLVRGLGTLSLTYNKGSMPWSSSLPHEPA